MPISIRFFIFSAITFRLKARFEPASAPPGGASESGQQRALVELELSRHLPPRLLRDVLRD